MFCIGFTKRRMDQAKRTCYAQTGQIRQIRKKMVEIISRETTTCDLKECVLKFIPEVIGKEIEKVCAGIYPLQNVYIRKVKILGKRRSSTSRSSWRCTATTRPRRLARRLSVPRRRRKKSPRRK